MTTPPAVGPSVTGAAPIVPGPPGTAPRVRNRSTWGLTWRGVRTVTVLELRQRVRSTRWWVVLGVWAIVLAVLTGLVHNALDEMHYEEEAGVIVFGVVVLLVLSLGGLVAPAITATSINGDRSAGVLATLQATLLTPAEIALGKLLAGWATSLALLAVSLPFLGWAYLDGGTPAGRLLVAVPLLAVMFLLVTAFALGMSAVTAKASSSAVLTYLAVAALGIGSPLLFGLSLPLVSQEDAVRVQRFEPTADPTDDEWAMECVTFTEMTYQTHTERIWWMLAANPYVVIADAMPAPTGQGWYNDPLTEIRYGVQLAKLGPLPPEIECVPPDGGSPGSRDLCVSDRTPCVPPDGGSPGEQAPAGDMSPAWPFGLAADLALGAAGFVLAVRRLRAPARKLPRGTRVA
jgi:ABC-type transport system involved in multi-copper enzyme maturation permease subunit